MKRRFLIAAAYFLAVFGLSGGVSNAGFIADLGVDPTSATGNFSNSLGTSTSVFADDYTFTLDRVLNLTIASATNVFPNGPGSSDFITNFEGAVFAGTPSLPGGMVLGPDFGSPCPSQPTTCQFLAGSAILGPGAYFLEISGTANGSSGYGGNLATTAVPGPIVGAGLPGLVAFLGGGWFWRRRKRQA